MRTPRTGSIRRTGSGWQVRLGDPKRTSLGTCATREEAESVLRGALAILAEGRRPRGAGWVYFVRAADHVKIGWSLTPMKRLGELQVANVHPVELLGVVAGTHADEHALHKRFAAHRVRGEWFHACDEILAHIAGLPVP